MLTWSTPRAAASLLRRKSYRKSKPSTYIQTYRYRYIYIYIHIHMCCVYAAWSTPEPLRRLHVVNRIRDLNQVYIYKYMYISIYKRTYIQIAYTYVYIYIYILRWCSLDQPPESLRRLDVLNRIGTQNQVYIYKYMCTSI